MIPSYFYLVNLLLTPEPRNLLASYKFRALVQATIT